MEASYWSRSLESDATLNDWTFSVQFKNSVSVVYIDFSKAFDSVTHSKLFAKLTACDISDCLSGGSRHGLGWA